MNVQKIKKAILIISIVLLIIVFLIVMSVRRSMRENPLLFIPEEVIQSNLLETIPIGTSMGDVGIIVAGNREWTIRVIREDLGVVLNSSGIPWRGNSMPGFTVIGEQSIEIHIGTYYFITRIDVGAYLAFNKDGELIEIFVRREYDVL